MCNNLIIISENEYEHKLDHVRNGQTYFLVKTEDGNAKDPDKIFVKNKIKSGLNAQAMISRK